MSKRSKQQDVREVLAKELAKNLSESLAVVCEGWGASLKLPGGEYFEVREASFRDGQVVLTGVVDEWAKHPGKPRELVLQVVEWRKPRD